MPRSQQIIVHEQYSGLRLDKALVLIFPDHSRSYFQNLLDQQLIQLNGHCVKANTKIKTGDRLEVQFPALEELAVKAKDIPLDIVYEDKNLLVINKPAGLVVHPGTHGSHADDSLVNAILFHCKGVLGGINGVIRPGIVHRLDKDTSGLLVVAKNDMTQRFLMDQFMNREVIKVYYALTIGRLEPKKGTIDAPIGRSLHDRKKMAVIEGKSSRAAITRYEVVRYYGDYTFVKIHLLTGRTHQIRVHFAAIGHPLVGDQAYGKAKVNHWFEKHFDLHRQFLHAGFLAFWLPDSAKKGGIAEFQAPLPLDLQDVLNVLDV